MDKPGTYKLREITSRPTTVIDIVDYIIASAIKLHASDIHIGPNNSPALPDAYILRFRINGKLEVYRSAFLNTTFREVV